MAEEMPHGRNACAVKGCWETLVVQRTRFCNTHRMQRQAKYRQVHGTPAPEELEQEQYESKQNARRTLATLQEYVSWVEEHGASVHNAHHSLLRGRASHSPEPPSLASRLYDTT